MSVSAPVPASPAFNEEADDDNMLEGNRLAVPSALVIME